VRFRLALVLASIAAVLAAVAAGAAPQTTATYLFKASFGVGYEVTWHTETGSPTACGWHRVDGTNEVNAASVDAPKTVYTVPGRFVIFDSATGGKITGAAVGRAKVEMTRTRVERGTPSCDNPPIPFTPPANDCGTKRYQTKQATLLGSSRKSRETLADIAAENPTRSPTSFVAISISIPPPPQLYRKCESSSYETGYAGSIGLPVKTRDMAALVKLAPGAVRRIRWEWSGDCARNIPADSSCKAVLDLHVDIRRWKPGEPYP
jgi:hypothetical protein